MTKEFIVVQISARGGTPRVALSFLEESVLKGKDDEKSPYYRRNLDSLIDYEASEVSMDLVEYASSGIRVGDRISVEVRKVPGETPEIATKRLETNALHLDH